MNLKPAELEKAIVDHAFKKYPNYMVIREIIKNQEIIKKIKRLLNRVGKMEQMEYGYMSWQDEIEDILEGKK